MRFLPSTQLSMDDWLIDIHFENGQRVRKAVSGHRSKMEAQYLAMQFVPPGTRGLIREVEVKRRKESGPLPRQVEERMDGLSDSATNSLR